MRKLFTAVLAGSLAVAAQGQEAKDEKKKVDPPGTAKQKKEAPPITLKAGDAPPALKADKWLQGKEVEKFETGKVYVVEMWATWCGPCIVMMPHLAELHEQYKDKVVIIGYSKKDPNNSEEKVVEFVKKRGPKLHYTFAYADAPDSYNDFMRAAGQNGIPCTFVIGKDTKIAYIGHPMFLDVVLPKVLAGTWKVDEDNEKIKDVRAEYSAAAGALRTDPKAGLKAFAEFEKKYPGLDKIPYTIGSKLTAMLKAEMPAEAKKFAGDVVARSIKAEDTAMLGQMAAALTGPDAKTHKDLLALALEAANANIRILGEKDALGHVYLAQALFANGRKADAKKAAEKALENAATPAAKNAYKTRLKEILDLDDATSSTVKPTKIEPSTDGKAVAAGEPIPVTLTAGDPKGPLAPNYSPKGTQAELKAIDSKLPGFDHLAASYKLGPQKDAKTQLIIARSAKDKPYDTLYIDADEKGIKVKPEETRGKMWSSFETVLKVDYAKTSLRSAPESYPVSLWVVAEKADEAPAVIRLSRRGYLAGSATIEGKKYDIVLSDSNNDAILGDKDWWELRPAGETGKGTGSRPVGDFHWAGEKAYKLELASANGKSAKLMEVKPGLTKAEDDMKRDRLREDRMAVRAAKPVEFRKDVDAAMKEVTEGKKLHFIKFETDWCGPCKTMTELVFTAKDVADASQGIVSIKVDGDERKDMVERFAVKAYPTGVLFGSDGKEMARFVGYQSVKEMAAFLKKAKVQ